MPDFRATFSLHKGGSEFHGLIPAQKFSTQGLGEKELWKKIFGLERSLSKKYEGNACYLMVAAETDIPGTNIKRGNIVAFRSLEK